MIWLVENGRDYSAWSCIFVETPSGFRMTEFLAACRDHYAAPSWIASTEAVELSADWPSWDPVSVADFRPTLATPDWRLFLPDASG